MLSKMQAKRLGKQEVDPSVCTPADGPPQPALLPIPISVVVRLTPGTICTPKPESMKLGLPLAMFIPVCLLPPVPQVPPGTTWKLCVRDWGAKQDAADPEGSLGQVILNCDCWELLNPALGAGDLAPPTTPPSPPPGGGA